MTFAEHLRHLRGHLTQTAFCRRLGIPLTTYQRYEKGERVPDIELLAQIVRCVGISADTLLGLNRAPDADEASGHNGKCSSNQPLDKKDAIIAHQAETIKTLSQAIKALS
jgi:transcriptional regulator with XRE-family HTH domain